MRSLNVGAAAGLAKSVTDMPLAALYPDCPQRGWCGKNIQLDKVAYKRCDKGPAAVTKLSTATGTGGK